MIGGFLGGWFLGVIATGILADVIVQTTMGHRHDGGMFVVAAAAVLVEAPILALLRAVLGRHVTGSFGFVFGFVCGPLILVLLIAIG